MCRARRKSATDSESGESGGARRAPGRPSSHPAPCPYPKLPLRRPDASSVSSRTFRSILLESHFHLLRLSLSVPAAAIVVNAWCERRRACVPSTRSVAALVCPALPPSGRKRSEPHQGKGQKREGFHRVRRLRATISARSRRKSARSHSRGLRGSLVRDTQVTQFIGTFGPPHCRPALVAHSSPSLRRNQRLHRQAGTFGITLAGFAR